MDADDGKKKHKPSTLQQSRKRWSMNCDRLAAIVQELMKPVSDVRQSFELDQSSLLESYLSQAGIHMYDGAMDMNAPINFTELAFLLQYSTSAYCRKVDLLYENVLQCSVSLQNSTMEMANSTDSDEDEGDDEGDETSRRQVQNDYDSDSFDFIELQPSPKAVRGPGCSRPPPTLPRSYMELGPPVKSAEDTGLTDYAGQNIGLLTDYNAGWGLSGGYLAENLAMQYQPMLHPIQLHELQQAIEARAPPPLEDISPPPTPPDVPLTSPSPPPTPASDSDVMPPPARPAPARNVRKRKCIEEIVPFKLHLPKVILKNLGTQEFSIPLTWRQNLIRKRSLGIVVNRRTLRRENLYNCEFPGWNASEVSSAQSRSLQLTSVNNTLSIIRPEDSDDDGFFEQSSTDSDCPPNMSTMSDCGLTSASQLASIESNSEWLAWQADVVQRAHEQETKSCDMRLIANTVLEAVHRRTHSVKDSRDTKDSGVSDMIDVDSDVSSSICGEPKDARPVTGGNVHPFSEILCDTAREPTDVSRLFLATLFLANSGNLEIVQGEPLSVSSFGVRLLTREDRLCSLSEISDVMSGDAVPDLQLANSTPLLNPNKKRLQR